MEYVLVLIVAALVVHALQPRPVQAKPAALEDFDVPTAEEGRPIPVVFGTVTITGANTVWYGALRVEEIKSTGGKK